MNKKIVSLVLGLGLAAMMATTLGACNQSAEEASPSPGASPAESPSPGASPSPTTSP